MIDDVTHLELNYDQISDFIYVGTNFCCQTHLDNKLINQGIKTIISLEEERIDAAFGASTYLWLPTKDHTAPSIDQMKIGITNLQLYIGMKRPVYVHCRNGHGRAPTLVAAYFISQGISVDDAINTLHKKRKGSHINDLQQEALIDFSKLYI